MPATRFSRQREAISTALRARDDHPTAETLYHSLREAHPNISLGTVYRNLALLEGQGEALRIRSQDGPDRYDGTTSPHDHLHCTRCGALVDLMDMGELVNMAAAKEAAARHGVKVERHQLSFVGLCRNCAANDAQ